MVDRKPVARPSNPMQGDSVFADRLNAFIGQWRKGFFAKMHQHVY